MRTLTLLMVMLVTCTTFAGEPKGGLVLAGGGDLDEVFSWMIERSGDGDFIVLASTDRYNETIKKLGKSVETLIIETKEQANSEAVVTKVKNAAAIFIGGGNQANYVEIWKGTKLLETLNTKVGKIPLGGVSAGMAIMGEFFYGAKLDPHESVSSEDCLRDPYYEELGELDRDFIDNSMMKGIVTDTHYTERQRPGRHLIFMARLIEKFKLVEIKGIGVDQDTAFCIDENGNGRVVGEGDTYFLRAKSKPEVMVKKTPLNWKKPIEVHVVHGGENFSVTNWEGAGKVEQWSIEDGELKRN